MKFAIAFKAMLDTELYTRAEWCVIFRVKERDIDAWLDGTGIPDPPTLRSISRILEEDHRWEAARILFKDAILERLPQNLCLDKRNVPKHLGKQLGTTLRQHMVEPILEGFLALLSTFPAEEQEEFIWSMYAKLRERRKQK